LYDKEQVAAMQTLIGKLPVGVRYSFNDNLERWKKKNTVQG